MSFVKSYIQMFAYSSVTTDDWKNYLFTYFKDKVRSICLYMTEGVFPTGNTYILSAPETIDMNLVHLSTLIGQTQVGK